MKQIQVTCRKSQFRLNIRDTARQHDVGIKSSFRCGGGGGGSSYRTVECHPEVRRYSYHTTTLTIPFIFYIQERITEDYYYYYY